MMPECARFQDPEIWVISSPYYVILQKDQLGKPHNTVVSIEGNEDRKNYRGPVS